MKKTTYALKSIVIALALLFTMALVIGITSAAYNASRKADGSLSMANGIVMDYSGFGKAQDGEWQNEQTTTFKLFTNKEILPGDTINLNAAAIKKGTDSIDFYARIKFEYKFYDALDADITATVGNEYTNFISTPAFNSAWVDGNAGDGWFYYATGTTLNTLPTSFVNIFSSSAINVELNVAGFNHEGGGYKFTDINSNEITIAKVEAILTLEAVQTTGSTWEVIPAYTDAAGVVYTQNANETWTLTDGTALSGNSSSSTATYSARIYTSSYSYTVLSTINNQDVVAIGDEAFLNASQLTSVEIPTTVTTIGSRAFEGTGLNAITLTENVTSVGANALNTNTLSEVTIENEDSVITGIAAAGIPTASTINVPSVVFSGYETTLGAGYTGLAQAPAPTASEGLAYSFDSTNSTYTVTGIGDCTDTAIVIPSEINYQDNGLYPVTSIGENAFANCSGLTSITIPSSVTSIWEGAFYGCSGLTSFSGGSSKYRVIDSGKCLVAVEEDNQRLLAFAPSSGVSTYAIPDSVTIIGGYAFAWCTSLTSISIPDSVTVIAGSAFNGCTGLTSIDIPNSVTSIASSAFISCNSLQTVTFEDGGTRSVLEIWNGAFGYCTALKSVEFGSDWSTLVQIYIAEDAFVGCVNLSEFQAPTPGPIYDGE